VEGGGWLLHKPDLKEPELLAKLTEDPYPPITRHPSPIISISI
jgi:hypothetical protein